MVNPRFGAKVGPGFITPARLFFALCLAAAASTARAQPPAQPPAQPRALVPAADQAGVPDSLVINKLVWSSMAALDHANRTGNYSVLRDLGAPSFQATNSATTLGGTFQALRASRVDLGYTLLVAPNFQYPPAIVQEGLLRVRGAFPLRPTAIGFDLLFQNVSGQWRIFGIAAAPIVAQVPQSGSTAR